MITPRQPDNSWGRPQPLDVINNFESKFAGLSPAGEVLFFVSHRQVEESNPEPSWNLDLFENLAIEDNADRYWVSSRILGEVLEQP